MPGDDRFSLGGRWRVEISPQGGDRGLSNCTLSRRIESGGSHTGVISVETAIDSRPDWYGHCFDQRGENVELSLPTVREERARVVRFEIAKRPLCCQIGDRVLATFPMRVAQLSGHASHVPDEESAYNRLFSHILSLELDAIYLDSVRPETLFWRYLQSSPLVQQSFRFYSQYGLVSHWLIRLNGSFNNYMKRFSPKTRKNRLREMKILRELGDVKLIRVTEASEIDAFLKTAYDISQKTRQFKLFGWSLAARDPRLVKNELLRLVQQGWLRSYLLTCGNAPCSFILGQQSSSRFYPLAVGVDPAWRNYSVGTVLLLLVLEDLFKENSPEFYDLGTASRYKEYLATDSYLDATVWLFRRRPYPALASSIYSICNLTSRVGGAALERLGFKGKVTQLMRRMDLVTARASVGLHIPKHVRGRASESGV